VGSGFFVSCLYCYSRKRYKGYTTITVEEMDTFERACSKAGRVRIPKQVLGSDDRAIAKAFLRGLFSADGCFGFQNSRGSRVEIQVKSQRLRDDFVYLTGRLGFSSRSYECISLRGENKAPLQVADTTQSGQCIRWMEEVGSLKDSHNQRYQYWKKLIERKR
jgi:intein/homing endonuclease